MGSHEAASVTPVAADAEAGERRAVDVRPLDEPVRPETSPSDVGRRRLYVIGLVLVVVLAGTVRAIPLFTALPYSHYVDEGHVVRASTHVVADGTWDPNFYDYPSGLIGASVVVASLKAAATGDFDELREEARRNDREGFYDPMSTDLLLSARVLVLLSSVGVVLLVAHLGRRFGGRSVGLVAGLLAAALPALVTRSAIAAVDAPATFFVLASLACALKIRGSTRALGWAVVAGGFAGLATGTKYTVGLVMVGVVAGIALDPTSSWLARLRRLGASGGAALVAFFLASPAFFLERAEVSQRLEALSRGYEGKTSVGYWNELITVDEVGWSMVALAMIGTTYALIDPHTRTMAITVLAFAGPFVAYMCRYSFQPFRNLYPVLALGCVAAAITLVVGGSSIATTFGIRWPWSPMVPALLAVCVAVMLLVVSVDAVRLDAQAVDARSQVRAWFADLDDCGRVLIPRELGFHPSELDGFGCDEVLVTPATEPAPEIDASVFDYVVTFSFVRPAADWAQPRWVGKVATFGDEVITEERWSDYRTTRQQMTIYFQRS